MTSKKCINCVENRRCRESAASLVFFAVGIVAILAVRAVTILAHVNPVYGQISWYVGILGFVIYFAYKFKIDHDRSRFILESSLTDKVLGGDKIEREDRQMIASVLCALTSTKDRINYLLIFVSSAIVLVLAVYLDFFDTGRLSMERKGVVEFKGSGLTLEGGEVKTGQKAPDFKVLSQDLKSKGLSDFKGKIKLIASVPSLDTPVCDMEIKRFNDEASKVSKDVMIIFVSMDLPFAQKRFCQEFDINKVETLSDHREASFGLNYGVLIKELRLLARAIFIVGKDDTVKYVQIVKEISSPPDYNAALKMLQNEAGVE